MVGTHKVALRRVRHRQPIDPGLFFEVKVEGGIERNEVVDGQQRLTTLFDFFNDDFSLVDSQDAPYLSPNSVHYAGKRFKELPQAYQQAFKKYRLTVIKLRNLEHMRLEVGLSPGVRQTVKTLFAVRWNSIVLRRRFL